MGIADKLAARKANKRMMKLTKRLQRNPGDINLKAELWLRSTEFCQHTQVGFGALLATLEGSTVRSDVSDASRLADMILAELGATEIADRIEHLDRWEAKALRARVGEDDDRK